MPGRREVAAPLALAAGGVVVALIVAEFTLRFLCLYCSVLQPHPRYLHALRPGSRQLMREDSIHPGRFYMVRIDSEGHRRGDDDACPGNARRVVVYGDSFIDARYEPAGVTFPARLEHYLKANFGDDLCVTNAGVAGYGPDQASLRLEDDLAKAVPALVIVAIFAGNDFGDLVRNKIYRLGPAGEAIRVEPVLTGEALRPFEEASPLHIARVIQSLRRKVDAWTVARTGRQAGSDETLSGVAQVRGILESRRQEFDSYASGDRTVRDLLNDGYDLDLAVTPDDPGSIAKSRLMGAVLARIRESTAAHGVPLLFVLIPTPMDVDDEWRLTIDPRAFPHYERRTLTDSLQASIDAMGASCLNLFGPFRDSGEKNLFRKQADEHWGPVGMDLAARLAAESIRSAGLLGTGSPPVDPPIRPGRGRAPS